MVLFNLQNQNHLVRTRSENLPHWNTFRSKVSILFITPLRPVKNSMKKITTSICQVFLPLLCWLLDCRTSEAKIKLFSIDKNTSWTKEFYYALVVNIYCTNIFNMLPISLRIEIFNVSCLNVHDNTLKSGVNGVKNLVCFIKFENHCQILRDT